MFQYANNFFVQLSDQSTACQDLNKIKQFTTRTTQASGIMNILFTVGYSSVPFSYFVSTMDDGDIYTYGYDIYENFLGVYENYSDSSSTTTASCDELGFYFGKIVSELLDFKIEDTVYFSEVYKYWADSPNELSLIKTL